MFKARACPTPLTSRQGTPVRVVGLLVGALLLGLHPGVSGHAAPPQRLNSVTTRTEAGVTTVVIETTEPVAYVTAQPDPLTLVIDLRNVAPGQAKASPVSGAVANVAFEAITADDGTAVVRVRLLLTQPIKPQVRSKWNTVIVEFGQRQVSAATPAAAEVKPAAKPVVKPAVNNPKASPDTAVPAVVTTPAPAAPAPVPSTPVKSVALSAAPAASATTPAGAATLTKVESNVGPGGTRIVFTGTGALTVGTVEPAKDLPPRLVVDFPGAQFTVPALTAVGKGPVDRIRVAMNSRQPMVTRAVIDLKYPVSHRVESRDGVVVLVLDEPAMAAP
ncbi:MAG: AMIN domain-containing protein, partial [Acidobacteria bacterium]|nr:AMIN domain-containing protein [Acidobacteriota bacterium]